MLPLYVCLEGSKLAADCGARLECLNIAKKAKVQQTLRAGPTRARLEVRRQKRCNSGGKMGSLCRGGVHIVMSAARRSDATWKDWSAAGASPSSLCRLGMPDK